MAVSIVDADVTKPVATKDLPNIKPEDIKLDISAIDKLGSKELEVIKQRWVTTGRSNEQLLFLLKQIPEKVDRINKILSEQKEPDKSLVDKIARLKEEYVICIKEIEYRKGAYGGGK